MPGSSYLYLVDTNILLRLVQPQRGLVPSGFCPASVLRSELCRSLCSFPMISLSAPIRRAKPWRRSLSKVAIDER